jgi:hypothetical protein
VTRTEFLKAIAYIAAGTGKTLAPESLEVYFDCLGDLPCEVLAVAAKRVVLEHKYATFPTVAELREAASLTARGQISDLSPAEAWALAWRAVADTDPEVDGSFERAAKKLKLAPLVAEAIRVYGLQSLCYGAEPVGVVRGQFLKIYEQLAARAKRAALLPAAVARAVAEIGAKRPAGSSRVAALLDGVTKALPSPNGTRE